mgnify:CR=1 FL=1
MRPRVSSTTVRKLCEKIAVDFRHHNSGVFIYGDATSKKADTKLEKGHNFFTLIRDYLSEFNPVLRVPASNPSVVMRGNFINQILEKGFQGITISIDQSCEKTIADFNNVKEDADGTKKKEREKNPATGVTFEKYGHTSDACDYFICKAMENDFNTYRTGRQTFDHVVVGFKGTNDSFFLDNVLYIKSFCINYCFECKDKKILSICFECFQYQWRRKWRNRKL